MNKKEFFKKLEGMEEPFISDEITEMKYDLINIAWCISDNKDWKKKFCTPMIHMLESSWRKNGAKAIEKYCAREHDTKRKYLRWIEEYKKENIKND
jgi:nicotinamide riboside kinase